MSASTIATPARNGRKATLAALALALALGVPGFADAQANKKAANPFQGFSADNGKPVDVNSEALEVDQNLQKAIFTGNVVATQGESVLRTPKLVVFYDNSANAQNGQTPTPPAAGTPSQANSIRRLEAYGGVIVTSQDQKATGENGVFDMIANTATLTGGVVLTQGANVIRGKQLVVDLKTGVAHVLGGTTGLFVPSKQDKPKAN
ncbi:LptA/OstA family protein [Labrys wisconsinensis]|uniref:Lipopolysaccharide export system protein LptA n=1 Tax=Labrys wisconsinensis TaxID=425677 RepID=A0ABU0JAM4_9HYPH|nr:LptA/OstA family protein [Labrys wisconsinensis]MDQ0470237.1 lipopolysaccharide export system protein LptA [Labrys wisconsinensis]